MALVGCGGREGKVLAKVGNRKITVREYEQAIPRVPSEYVSKKSGVEGTKENLQIIIDRELLMLEAQKKGIDKEKQFPSAWERAKHEVLYDELMKREIKDKTHAREEEKKFEARLMELFDVKFDQKTLAYLLDRGKTAANRMPDVPIEEEGRSIVTFKGGKYTVGEYLTALGQLKPSIRPAADDSAGVVVFVREALRRVQLPNLAIQHFKLEDDPKVASRLRDRRQEMITDVLIRREVGEKAQPSEEEVEEYFQARKARYLNLVPAQAHVRGVAMETERDAIKLRRAIKGSGDFQRLVESRKGKTGWPVAGEFHLHPFQTKSYGDVAAQAFQVPLGKVIGPVRVPRGFMIYEVMEREDQGSPESAHYGKVRQAARAELRAEKASQLYGEFLLSLRRKYADQTFIYDERLKLVKSQSDTTRTASPDTTRITPLDTTKATAQDSTTTRKG